MQESPERPLLASTGRSIWSKISDARNYQPVKQTSYGCIGNS